MLSLGFNFLLILIASAPLLAMVDGLLAEALIALLTCVTLLIVAIAARAGDIAQFAQIVRRLRYLAILPVVWMLVQIVPLPFGGLAHSIWGSAAAALGQRMPGHISVDPGATLQALGRYLAGLALIAVTIVLTRDRRRAELVLQAVCVIISFAVVELATVETGSQAQDMLAAFGGLGLVLNLAALIRVLERYESRRGEAGQSLPRALAMAAAWAVLALVCLAALLGAASANVRLVGGFGVVTLALVQAFRRFAMPPWSIAVLCATVAVAEAMLVARRYDPSQAVSPFLQFASQASSDAISTAQRMIADASLLGDGAGTFTALAPIYQEAATATLTAPTMAASIAIEWGEPALLVVIAASVTLLVMLFLAALSRGRDSFFPAAAAGCVTILLGEAFCDPSLSDLAVSVVGELVVGLGLGQSLSRVGTG